MVQEQKSGTFTIRKATGTSVHSIEITIIPKSFLNIKFPLKYTLQIKLKPTCIG